MKRIAAAILRRNDKILICRRGPGGSCGYLWEFPGGKYGFAFYDGVIISGEPEKRVHLEILWVSPEELTDFSFCPADRPMVERLSRPI